MAITKDSASAQPSTPGIEQIAQRVEAELMRLRAARPALSDRIDRAEQIITTHLSCKRARIIRVRVAGDGRARFLVQGSAGAVYVVDPTSWQCSCPDAHRRGRACKHALATFALWRASRSAPSPRGAGDGDPRRDELECDGCGLGFRARDLFTVGDDTLSYFEGDLLCAECALDCDGTLL